MLNFRHFFPMLWLFPATFLAQTSIQHVEPLNWWVGMNDPNLQLLIHGNNLGETTPVIKYPGVSIQKSHKADSKNYLFLDLQIRKNTKPGTFTISFYKNGKVVDTYPYTLLERQKDAAQIKGFDASDVIYLITPDG